ncbi:unnamed protein product [Protopolystoma xenopodis]|uniref:ABC transmembrane type-1 domain-containing protein n=1 Tax=Protopolystoma xenopodis TaxID=117903 RepID=A0A448WRW0_9PLAT|nr:unnamed protein product [Protopolystoma xenopodis]
MLAILRQDVTWFDGQDAGSSINNLSDSIESIAFGIGENVGAFIRYVSIFIAGVIISFVKGWKLSLVTCSMLPFVTLSFASVAFILKYFHGKQNEAYNKASAISFEVLKSLRTVFSFGGEEKELARYCKELDYTQRVGIKRSTALGFRK